MPRGLQGYFFIAYQSTSFPLYKGPAVGYKSLSTDVEWNGRYEPIPINKQILILVFTVLQN